MCFGILAKLLILHRPARQSASGLLDVGFREVADAKGEQLHQLASEIFVGMFPAIAGSVEPDQERRVAHGGVEQISKSAAGTNAKGLILPAHEREVVDLGIAGGEVVVPHEREPLAQGVRPEDHSVDPPRP